MSNTYEKLGQYSGTELPQAPINVEITAVDNNEIDLSWTNSTLHSGSTIIIQSWIGNYWLTIKEIDYNSTSTSITELSEGTNYRLRIAVLLDGVIYPSNPFTQTTTTNPILIADLTATLGMNAIQIDWTSEITDEYTQYKKYVAISTTETFDTPIEISLTQKTYLFTGLSVTTLYNYKTIVADAITEAEIYSETGSTTTLSADNVKASSHTLCVRQVSEPPSLGLCWTNNNTIDTYNLYKAIKTNTGGIETYDYTQIDYDAFSAVTSTFHGDPLIPMNGYSYYVFAAYEADFSQALWSIGAANYGVGLWSALRATSPVFVEKTYSGVTYSWTNNDIYLPDVGSDDYQKVAYTIDGGGTWAYRGLIDFEATGHTWTGLTESTLYSFRILYFFSGADYTDYTLSKTSSTLGIQTTEEAPVIPVQTYKLVGNWVNQGWTCGESTVEMTDIGDGNYQYTGNFIGSYGVDWWTGIGRFVECWSNSEDTIQIYASDFSGGTLNGVVVAEGDENFIIGEMSGETPIYYSNGEYTITVNFTGKTITVERVIPQTLHLVGNFNSWTFVESNSKNGNVFTFTDINGDGSVFGMTEDADWNSGQRFYPYDFTSLSGGIQQNGDNFKFTTTATYTITVDFDNWTITGNQ